MTTKRKRVKIPHYGPCLTLTLIVSEDIAAIRAIEKPNERHETSGGLTWLDWPKCCIMLREDYLDRDTVSHEATHAVHKILRHVGMIECDESEEAYAYLNGWIVGWIWKTLDRWAKAESPVSGPQ